MAENTATPEYNWDEVSGQAVERLAAPKVTPVPDAIVRQAQRSYDGVPLTDKAGKEVLKDGKPVITHNLRHTFPSEDMAKSFAKLMSKAGPHVKASDGRGSSITVVIDPDSEHPEKPVNPRVVAWKAGARRGAHAQV